MSIRRLAPALIAAFLTVPAQAAPATPHGPLALEQRLADLEAQVAALQQQVDVHAANASAHHARYADAEAVTAVGPHFSGSHADLSNVTAAQHHVVFSGSHAGLTNVTAEQHHVAFSGSHADLTNVTAEQHHVAFSGNHDDLSNVTSDQHHVPATAVPGATAWEFVGVTDTHATGDEGLAHFDFLCHSRYPGSRTATSAEFAGTPAKPYWPGLPAWIRPVLGAAGDGSLDLTSGARFDPGLGDGSCDGWRDGVSTVQGLSVAGNGRFLRQDCDSALPVACVLPATP